MDGRGPDVLLVDPDGRVRRALRTLLGASGLVVHGEAGDADAARRALNHRGPAVAVVEPLLPTAFTGCALVGDLCAHGTRVVGLTSDARLHEPVRSAGAVAVLTKDCAPEDLLEVILGAAEASWPYQAPRQPDLRPSPAPVEMRRNG